MDVGFSFTGTKEAIKNARLLIEVHIKHLKSMDELREQCDDLNRILYPQRNNQLAISNGYSNSSASNSNNANWSRNFNSGQQSGQNRYRNGSASSIQNNGQLAIGNGPRPQKSFSNNKPVIKNEGVSIHNPKNDDNDRSDFLKIKNNKILFVFSSSI